MFWRSNIGPGLDISQLARVFSMVYGRTLGEPTMLVKSARLVTGA